MGSGSHYLLDGPDGPLHLTDMVVRGAGFKGYGMRQETKTFMEVRGDQAVRL